MKMGMLDVGHHYAIKPNGWKRAKNAMLIEKHVPLVGEGRNGKSRTKVTGVRMQVEGETEIKLFSSRAIRCRWSDYVPPPEPVKVEGEEAVPQVRRNGKRPHIAGMSSYCDFNTGACGIHVAYEDGRVFVLSKESGYEWVELPRLPK